jgi:hypothetical protein
MRYVLGIAAALGLAIAGASSTALAKGGAEGAILLPTLDAITCTAELTVPNCESDGYGSAATLRIGRQNYMGFDVTNLIAGQTYLAANNDVGLESCAGVLTSFVPGPAGAQNFTVPVDSAAGFVSICREVDGMLVPVLTGEMGRLNGR